MKCPRLITCNRLAVVSAILCIAIISLGLRSFWRFDQVKCETCSSNHELWRGDGYELGSLHGVLWFRHYWLDFLPGQVPPENLRNRIQPILHVGWTAVARLDPPSEGPLVGIGAGLAHHVSTDASGTFAGTYYILPDWLLATLLALMPMFTLTRLVRTKRRMQKRMVKELCPSCGYDLRASPDRCPECGAVPAGKIKPPS